MNNWNKLKFVIVEDDSLSAAALSKIIASYGAENIFTFTNGIEAISFLQQNKADIILMDIGLDGKLDGIETAKILDKNIPVLFASGNKDSETFRRIAGTGSFGFIQKPYTPALVKEAIDNALV